MGLKGQGRREEEAALVGRGVGRERIAESARLRRALRADKGVDGGGIAAECGGWPLNSGGEFIAEKRERRRQQKAR